MALVVRRLLLVLAFFSALGFAQGSVERARAAVEAWLSGEYRVDPMSAVARDPKEALKLLEQAVRFPPPPAGLEVNLDAPQVEARGPGVVVRYPAAVGDRTGEVVVELRGGEVWGVRWQPEGGLLPPWVVAPYSGPAFLGVGLLLMLALFRGGLRRAWRAALEAIRARARLFFWTQVGLYAAFALGAAGAYADPELARLVQRVVGAGIGQIGIEAALAHGPLGLAAAIFYWNFTRGLLLTTALPALLFGLPALVINLLRYYLLGFALSPAVVPVDRLLLHLPVIVLELGAYNTAVFGGLALLGEVLAGRGWRRGLRILGLSLVPATVLLFFAALYEAFELMP